MIPDDSTNSSDGKGDQETNKLIKCLFVSRWTENIKWTFNVEPNNNWCVWNKLTMNILEANAADVNKKGPLQ